MTRTSLRTAPFLSLLFFPFEEKSAGIGKSVGLAEEEEEGGEEVPHPDAYISRITVNSWIGEGGAESSMIRRKG